MCVPREHAFTKVDYKSMKDKSRQPRGNYLNSTVWTMCTLEVKCGYGRAGVARRILGSNRVLYRHERSTSKAAVQQ